MNIEDIQTRIVKIIEQEDDWELAHIMEDDLLFDVLKAISEGSRYPVELSKEALKVRSLDFPRPYNVE